MFKDFNEKQMELMEDSEELMQDRMVRFAVMQDQFHEQWDMEIEEMQEALQHYIDQGENDVI